MEIGIVGLPNVGKSTLFNALTSGDVPSSNYPFTTINPNIGVVFVPDPRLNRLAQIFNPKKVTPTTIRFVDIAGLVKGASTGAGLGNQFLSNIREVDAIVHVVRLFQDPDVVHSLGAVDPLRDVEVIETELALADLQSIEKQIGKVEGAARSGDKESQKKFEILEKLRKTLNAGKPARQSGLHEEELRPFSFLTAKPVLYLGNEEEDRSNSSPFYTQLKEFAELRGARSVVISGKIEAELVKLPSEEEKISFREALGMKERGLDIFIRESYALLGLVTFFTAGPTEVRAWTVTRGSTATQAAGKIHSDIAEGFIRAEIYKYQDIDQYGSEKVLQENGLKRSEGRDYSIQDGDVCYFHFR